MYSVNKFLTIHYFAFNIIQNDDKTKQNSHCANQLDCGSLSIIGMLGA